MASNSFVPVTVCICMLLLPMIALARPASWGEYTELTPDFHSKNTNQSLSFKRFLYRFFNIERKKKDVHDDLVQPVSDTGTSSDDLQNRHQSRHILMFSSNLVESPDLNSRDTAHDDVASQRTNNFEAAHQADSSSAQQDTEIQQNLLGPFPTRSPQINIATNSSRNGSSSNHSALQELSMHVVDGEETPNISSNDTDVDTQQSINQGANSNIAGGNNHSLEHVEEAGDHMIPGANQNSNQDEQVGGEISLPEDSSNATLIDKDEASEEDIGSSNSQSGSVGQQNEDGHENGAGNEADSVHTLDGGNSPEEQSGQGQSKFDGIDHTSNHSLGRSAENDTAAAGLPEVPVIDPAGIPSSDQADGVNSHSSNLSLHATTAAAAITTTTTITTTTAATTTTITTTTTTARTTNPRSPPPLTTTTTSAANPRTTLSTTAASIETTTLSTTASTSTLSEAATSIATPDSLDMVSENHKISATTSPTTSTLSSSTLNLLSTPTVAPTQHLTPNSGNIVETVSIPHPTQPIGSGVIGSSGTHGLPPSLLNDTLTTQDSSPETGPTSESPGTSRSFVELKFDMTWAAFCSNQMNIKQELIRILADEADQRQLTSDQIQLVNFGDSRCSDTSGDEGQALVHIYFVNKMQIYDRDLTVKCARILVRGGEPLASTNILHEKLIEVRLQSETEVQIEQGGNASGNNPDAHGSSDSHGTGKKKGGGEEEGEKGTDQGGGKVQNTTTRSPHPLADTGVLVAVIIASIGVLSCLAVVALQIAARRRKQLRKVLKRTLNRSESMNSADSIQLAAVTKSRPNSGLFNPALDIAESILEPSHQMNFAQLADFCSDENKVAVEFEKLPNRMPRLSVVPTGEEDKNRFANVLPLTLTRVKLLQDGPEPRSSYINANYVTGPDSQCQYYIATQAPTEGTIDDFWTMVWQQSTKAIVMLTQMEEDGQKKCTPYWPDFVGKSAAQKYGDFLIELKNKEVCQEYIASELQITHLRKIENRPIFHFWYTCWPTKSLPEPISLVKLVLDSRTKYEDAGVPVVVHCSPGTGRTGTFIALDQCMHQFETRRTVDVMKTVYSLRQERAGAVQSKEQYTLLYQAAKEYASIIESPGPSAASSATTLHALLPSS